MSPEELSAIAKYMGELCGAAKQDWLTANPADVGLNGICIVHWREAYFEGCKDMASGIYNRLPEPLRADFSKTFKTTMDAEIERLKAPT